MQDGKRAVRVLAIISAFNEADVIGPVIGHLAGEGVEVFLLDNHSSDATVVEARSWLGRGLIGVERFPASGPDGLFRWQEILERKLAVASQLLPDWIIHHDADEIRYSPWPGVPLLDAIQLVDRLGFNAIDFRLVNFPPVDDGFKPGGDPAEYFTLYEGGPERDRVQIKCWKWDRDARFVDGGHDVELPGKKVFPIRFLLCHYPVRSQVHGRRKIFRERKDRFVEEERATGWHIQYDEIESPEHVFFRNPASLRRFDRDSLRISLQFEQGGIKLDESHSPRPSPTPHEGALDVAGPDRISGWAWSPGSDEPVKLDIWASDRLLATVQADAFRPDLQDRGIDSGSHAFSLPVENLAREGRRYWIWANIAGTAMTLANSPRPFERRSKEELQRSEGLAGISEEAS